MKPRQILRRAAQGRRADERLVAKRITTPCDTDLLGAESIDEHLLMVPASGDPRYAAWIAAYDSPGAERRSELTRQLAVLPGLPLISVLLPVFEPDRVEIEAAVSSVRDQWYENWELCIADDGSNEPWVREVLDSYALGDGRIRVVHRPQNGHIVAATNSALALASGEWVVCLDQDDILAPQALAMVVLAATASDAALVYSDEDHLDRAGCRIAPYFKPDFDPVLLLGQNYMAHLCALRRDVVEAVGGYRPGLEGSQDWDLCLRVVEQIRPEQIVHVPEVLYHWRARAGSTAELVDAKPYAVWAGRRAVAEHLERTGRPAVVAPFGETGFLRSRWELPRPCPPVGLVVPSRRPHAVARFVASVRNFTTYPTVEVIAVHDETATPALLQELRRHSSGLRVVGRVGTRSDPELRNEGAAATGAEVMVFCDDEAEVLAGGWLDELVALVSQPGIAAAGAKLLYSDLSVAHGGIVTGIGGTAGRVQHRLQRLDPGYCGRGALLQCWTAVSAACLAVRADVFWNVGGFDPAMGTLADVDLCLRIADAGWRVAWNPFAELLLHRVPDEPAARGVVDAASASALRNRWGDRLLDDPAYNPNLSLAFGTFSLGWPPRAPKLPGS